MELFNQFAKQHFSKVNKGGCEGSTHFLILFRKRVSGLTSLISVVNDAHREKLFYSIQQ